jgi:polyphenol oxidase
MEEALSHLYSSLLQRAGVVHLFPTRHGGVSEGAYASLNLGGSVGDASESFEENMQRVARLVGTPRGSLYSVWQMHGREVIQVSRESNRKDISKQKADALITNVRGVGVGVRTADCTPILLFDPRSEAVAAIHAGWRGTVLDIVGATIEAMQRAYQTEACDLIAAIGPCIGPCCFEVGPEVVDAFAAKLPESLWRGPGRSSGKATIDLYAANEAFLRGAGVTQIDTLRVCTMCDPAQRFFSFRRDGEKSGRHLSIIIKSEE